MIPFGDDNSKNVTTPVVTYALLLLNVCVFLLEMNLGEPFILKWSFVPSRFLEAPLANTPTIFTAMFMHAGLAHIVGNMLYLWIFGDNVEERLGKVRFLLFYLFCGIAATFAQLAIDPSSTLPNLGASGAIAGVLGAYLKLFPHQKVKVLVGRVVTEMPALVVIGFWFLLQFVGTVGALQSTQEGGGVAYMAHVGGFLAGLLVALFVRAPK
ncbi:MAG: rhomboid family intramembrane serine protease [Chlamydiia bacterium]|nr:rhomboid family intramembrane serine protease [Chlamydiia bacterium]